MTINKNWLYVGAGAVVLFFGYRWYQNRQANTNAQAAQQQPAADAAANYTVPPDLGMQVDNTGGVQFPTGTPPNTTVTTTKSQHHPLPLKK